MISGSIITSSDKIVIGFDIFNHVGMLFKLIDPIDVSIQHYCYVHNRNEASFYKFDCSGRLIQLSFKVTLIDLDANPPSFNGSHFTECKFNPSNARIILEVSS